jgi:hypothetical protein
LAPNFSHSPEFGKVNKIMIYYKTSIISPGSTENSLQVF